MKNNSPWIYQLDHGRETASIRSNLATDVLVIGGGIAGACSAYYILMKTDKKIVLMEGNRVAHGATGHNAGYVVADFEKPFQNIVSDYGKEKALSGLRDIQGAWELLEQIILETKMEMNVKPFISYGGYSSYDNFLLAVRDEYLMRDTRDISEKILVSIESRWFEQLVSEEKSICLEVPQSVLLNKLETKDQIYHGVLPQKTAVINSALFTEKLILYCLKNFHNRFSVLEHSPVHRIRLTKDFCASYSGEFIIESDSVVLATNGFENFSIENVDGIDIDTKFHHLVRGVVGYMMGYTMHGEKPPYASFYYPSKVEDPDPYITEPYFYLTRRKFRHGEYGTDMLVSIGGPEVYLDDRSIYHHEYEIKEDIATRIHSFIENSIKEEDLKPRFHWHGLMGYTTTGIRIVGHEPCNPRLLYNLGCNGIGVLPSIYGGWKIGNHIAGVKMEGSIFDPKDNRCH